MSDSWTERAERVLLDNYYPARLTLVRGAGCRVTDDAGRSYLDLIGGIAVNSLGHCHPAIVRRSAAVRDAVRLRPLPQPWSVRLAEELPRGSPEPAPSLQQQRRGNGPDHFVRTAHFTARPHASSPRRTPLRPPSPR
jgi:4-aminobutyrate aminotransferase-like enzyme